MKLVHYDGTETEVAFEPSAVLAYAHDAANKFGIGNSRTVEFDVVAANAAIKERVEKDGSKGKKGAKKKKAA